MRGDHWELGGEVSSMPDKRSKLLMPDVAEVAVEVVVEVVVVATLVVVVVVPCGCWGGTGCLTRCG